MLLSAVVVGGVAAVVVVPLLLLLMIEEGKIVVDGPIKINLTMLDQWFDSIRVQDEWISWWTTPMVDRS